jgi:hypothetical protein
MAYKSIVANMKTIEADGAGGIGDIINVYDTYANALAHAASGLIADLYTVDVVSGEKGVALPQTAKTAGPVVDNNGVVIFAVNDSNSEVYLMSDSGRFGGPKRIVVLSTFADLESLSSSSSSSSSSSASSESSSSNSSSSNSSSSNSSSSSTEASETSSSSSSSST